MSEHGFQEHAPRHLQPAVQPPKALERRTEEINHALSLIGSHPQRFLPEGGGRQLFTATAERFQHGTGGCCTVSGHPGNAQTDLQRHDGLGRDTHPFGGGREWTALGNKDVERCSTPRRGRKAPDPMLWVVTGKMGDRRHSHLNGFGWQPVYQEKERLF